MVPNRQWIKSIIYWAYLRAFLRLWKKSTRYNIRVKKALYGLKSSGAAFRAMLAGTIYNVGYRPTKADPDVWIRPAVKPDGFKYYELILVYVDDVISISGSPMDAIKGIKAVFKLKRGQG